jgi:hypothetical protein
MNACFAVFNATFVILTTFKRDQHPIQGTISAVLYVAQFTNTSGVTTSVT